MKQGYILTECWAYVGARLANEDSAEQIKFFKSFLKECNSWGTAHQVQMQLASINDGLTDEEKRDLSMISYIEGE